MRGFGAAVAVAVGSIAACFRLGAYACSGDDSCVDGIKQGICESSGYCSYPDPDCNSGQRYDDLAGDGLQNQCVEPTPSGTSGVADGGESSGEGSSSGESGSSDGPIDDCADADGDGYGEGTTCLGADCDDDNAAVSDQCVYIGPSGDDTAPGTRDAPWGTFAFAVSQLQPGMSLVVLDGTYVPETHGMLDVSCTDRTATTGTMDAPIFVRAENERRAELRTGGRAVGIGIDGCAHWRVRGLHVSGEDAPGSNASIHVYIRDASEIELRRLLVNTDNRYRGAPLMYTPGADGLLLEECELYDFSGVAIYGPGAARLVIRRSYFHGRSRADLPECVADGTPDEPECTSFSGGSDDGVVLGDGALVENAVFEEAGIAITASGKEDVVVVGVAAIGGVHAMVFGHDADGGFATRIRVEDVVGVGVEHRVVYLRSVEEATVRNVTGVECAGAVLSDLDGGQPCAETGCHLDGANLLSLGGTGTGLSMADGNGGTVRFSNAHGNATDYSPSDDPIDDEAGYWQQCLNVPDPRIGTGADQCLAWVPADSPMSGAGLDGADIGGNLLYRWVDGELGTEPLWDPETGAFPCGVAVAGVNDDPAISCIGVAARLHVATAGCPLPPGYG